MRINHPCEWPGKLFSLFIAVWWSVPALSNFWQPMKMRQQSFSHYLDQLCVYFISMNPIILTIGENPKLMETDTKTAILTLIF